MARTWGIAFMLFRSFIMFQDIRALARSRSLALSLSLSLSLSLFCDGKHNGKKASLVTPMRTPCFFKRKGTSLTHGFGRMESTIGPLG